MRQPKIYIRLPSNGEYWPEGSLDISETGEYPVFSMTAKDELLIKIPDALLNGQAVVDVIQNCMPNIKNAWDVPSLDIDTILIAIRIATYGELMNTPINLPGDIEYEYKVDLRVIMDNLYTSIQWDPIITVSPELTLFVRPLNYKQISLASIQSFETQKIINTVNNESLTEEQKLEAFQVSFAKLTEVTIGVVKNSVFRVDTDAGSTDNSAHIEEFIDNIDKNIFNIISDHLEKLKNNNNIKPLVIETPEELKMQGYEQDTITVPLVFDPSTFFV